MSVLGDNPTPVYVVDADNPVSGGAANPVYVVNHADFVAGITDHAELENLAYADAGHTGFLPDSALAIEFGTGLNSVQQRGFFGVGQITLTNGSAAVVGIGTTFLGDSGPTTLDYYYYFILDGEYYYFDSIEDETHATLSVAWALSTQTVGLQFLGNNTTGDGATTLGLSNTNSGNNGILIGRDGTVSSLGGVGIGGSNNVSGERAVAVGYNNNVAGSHATAVGAGLVAPAILEVAVGAYNTDYTPANDSTDRAFSVGNGGDGARSNAFVVQKNGNAELFGTLRIDGFRIDQTPTSGVIVPDKYITISCNGVNYNIPVKAT